MPDATCREPQPKLCAAKYATSVDMPTSTTNCIIVPKPFETAAMIEGGIRYAKGCLEQHSRNNEPDDRWQDRVVFPMRLAYGSAAAPWGASARTVQPAYKMRHGDAQRCPGRPEGRPKDRALLSGPADSPQAPFRNAAAGLQRRRFQTSRP